MIVPLTQSRGEELRLVADGPFGSGQGVSIGRPSTERTWHLTASELPQPEDLLLVPATGKQHHCCPRGHNPADSSHTGAANLTVCFALCFCCMLRTHSVSSFRPASPGTEPRQELSPGRYKMAAFSRARKRCLLALPGNGTSNKPTSLTRVHSRAGWGVTAGAVGPLL